MSYTQDKVIRGQYFVFSLRVDCAGWLGHSLNSHTACSLSAVEQIWPKRWYAYMLNWSQSSANKAQQ